MLNGLGAILKEIISKKDISFLVFIISLFLLPLSMNFSSLTLIISLVLKSIQVLLKRDVLFATKALKNAAIIGLCFFIYILVNSIFQTDIYNTVFHFEKQYMHFALLAATPVLLRKKRENMLLLYAFFLGTILAVFFVFIYAIIKNLTFDKYSFLSALDLHHTYLSMYLLTLVNFCMAQIMVHKKALNINVKIGLIVLMLVSLGVIYMLDSKVSMVIFLFLFIVHSLPELSKNKAPLYLVILSLILCTVLAFNNKVNINYNRALDFRLQIWEVSFEIFENNPIFGNSTLPEKDVLNYHHYLNGKYYYLDSDLNSHNEYLSILMRFGLVGLLILLFYGINIFKTITLKTSKHTVREFLGFAIIIFIVCYIENVLDRHHGIVYLSFFYNYYLVAIENAEG